MRRYLARRMLFAVLTLWGVTILVFGLSRLGPDPLLAYVRDDTYGLSADTVAELKAKWGLDKPVYIQYFVWLGNILQGDMGESIATQRYWCAENMRLQLLENTEIAHAASRVRFRTMEICALDVLRGGGLESLGLSPGFRVWGRRRKAAEIAKLVQEFPITPGISPGENEQILEWLGLLTARRNIEPGNVPDTWHWVLKKYVERKTDQQFLDLDDLIHLAILAMERDPEVRSWQETRSRHLLVDDFQDITPVQYGLLELMAGPSGSITFGADPNQCIEIRRGADPHLEESFRKDWPTLDIHHLRLNHRCTRALVRAANSWASHLHPEGLRTDLQEAARVEEGTTPTLIGLHDCPEAVGAQFLELAWQVRQLGFAWEDMAIILP